MKTIQQLQAADLQRCLQHKIGEQLRAMYADEAYRKPSARLLDLLRDFEKIEIGGEFRKRDGKKAIVAGLQTPFEWRRS